MPEPLSSAQGDEHARPRAGDESLGRLLTLSDGVFAIAMTLLALDLHLPDLGTHLTDARLRDALGDRWQSYLSYVISFYVVAGYWNVHRRAMRGVAEVHPRLVLHTLLVLFLVAALPFPASVLGAHGELPSALALYAAFNIAANLALLRLLNGLRGAPGVDERPAVLADIAVFVLCIPGAYILRENGPFLLLLLIVSGRLADRRRGDVAPTV
jgi:uncharacterized membrane protein